MKKTSFCIVILLCAFTTSYCQLLVPKSNINNDDPIPRIEIDGLGSISNSQSGNGLSPSANVFVKLLPIPNDRTGKARLFLGFNLGSEQDSTSVDSIKLSRLFLPDQSRTGYITRASYNILPLIIRLFPNNKTISTSNYTSHHKEDSGKYFFTTELNPFIEYNYNKINIRNAIEDSSRIQTTTWIGGLNFVHQIVKEENSISFHLNYFHKWVSITEGTFGVYQRIFRKTARNAADLQTLKFTGIAAGMQINRFLFSFSWENLKDKEFERTPLYGGVFTIRATVIGDFIKL